MFENSDVFCKTFREEWVDSWMVGDSDRAMFEIQKEPSDLLLNKGVSCHKGVHLSIWFGGFSILQRRMFGYGTFSTLS